MLGSGCEANRTCCRYYLEKPSLTIIGKPSAKLASQLRKQTKERLAQRQTELGEEGLQKLQDKLDAAQQANDIEAPSDVISNFKIPDVEGIRWISVNSAAAGSNTQRFSNTVQSHVQADTSDVPYFLQFERESDMRVCRVLGLKCLPTDIQSNFIEISIFLDAADLPRHKDLLTLYTSSFHSLPLIEADGSTVPYDEVVKLLDTETVDYGISFGSALSEQLEISIKVEKDKYREAVIWLRKLLFSSEFSIDR